MFSRMLQAIFATVMLLSLLTACEPILQHGTPVSAIIAGDKAEPAGLGVPYHLMPGDQLEIQHVLDPDYSAVVTVAPDGSITLPGLKQQVPARGLTLAELTATLQSQYREDHVLAHPYFSLTLRSSANLQVFVGGEVERPGYIDVSGGERRVMQMIASAGGFLPTARRREVIVVRTQSGGGQQIFAVNTDKVLHGTDLAQNVIVHPLDVILVPKSDVASFDVWVDQYIRQALPIPGSASLTYTNNPAASFLK